MRNVINARDWVKARKAAHPTPRQQIEKEIFEAVEGRLSEDHIDRDDYSDWFVWPDEVSLASVVKEENGTVWARVTFCNTVDLPLSELRLPPDVQARVTAQLEQLTRLKASKGRGTSTKVAG